MIQKMLEEYLKCLGTSLVGFADLKDLDTSSFNNMKYGISFGVKMTPEIVIGIKNGPTQEYYDEYIRLNNLLDHITTSCVKHIISMGYNALGQTSTYVTSDNNLSTVLPHKTVATRAGLGWIGKNALLITPQYGSAIRISSVITNMELKPGTPINESHCGNCTRCQIACPASAIKGSLWSVGSKREDLFDAFKCRQTARNLLKEKIGVESALCGKCIEVCPFTRKYINENMAQ